jgi:hypothetical protein
MAGRIPQRLPPQSRPIGMADRILSLSFHYFRLILPLERLLWRAAFLGSYHPRAVPLAWRTAYCPYYHFIISDSSFHVNCGYGGPHSSAAPTHEPSLRHGGLHTVLIIYLFQAHPSTWTAAMAGRIPQRLPPPSRLFGMADRILSLLSFNYFRLILPPERRRWRAAFLSSSHPQAVSLQWRTAYCSYYHLIITGSTFLMNGGDGGQHSLVTPTPEPSLWHGKPHTVLSIDLFQAPPSTWMAAIAGCIPLQLPPRAVPLAWRTAYCPYYHFIISGSSFHLNGGYSGPHSSAAPTTSRPFGMADRILSLLSFNYFRLILSPERWLWQATFLSGFHPPSHTFGMADRILFLSLNYFRLLLPPERWLWRTAYCPYYHLIISGSSFHLNGGYGGPHSSAAPTPEPTHQEFSSRHISSTLQSTRMSSEFSPVHTTPDPLTGQSEPYEN